MTRKQIVILVALGVFLVCICLVGGLIAFGRLAPKQAQPPPPTTPVEAQESPAEPTATLAAATATPEPFEFAGDGDSVWEVGTNGGVFVVSSVHSGKRNFVVKVVEADTGDLAAIAANCIGNCTDQKVVRLEPGKYLVEIGADGEWEVRFERQ